MTPEIAAALVDALGDAFAAGDTAAVLAAFAEGDDIVYTGSEAGECAVGRAALGRLLRDLFARDERYLWRSEVVHVSSSDGSATVVAEARLYVLPSSSGPHPSPVEDFPYRVSGVLVRGENGWRWRFCQGAEPRPAELN